jgi:putative hydrolase of the HAD superfamily
MGQSAIRLVCLDLGGVLIRVCGSWEDACRAAKLELPASLAQPTTVEQLVRLNHLHETGQMNEQAYDREVAGIVGISPEQAAAASRAWLGETYPGAHQLIEQLAANSAVRSACLSNTNLRHWEMMTSPGPHQLNLHRLTWQFVSFRIGHMKPSAELFQYVQTESGLPAEEILFFDDNAANVAAARACGWNAEQIDPRGDPPAQVRSHLARFATRL